MPFCSYGYRRWLNQWQSVAQLPPGPEFPVSVREPTAGWGFRGNITDKKCYWTILHRVCNSFLPFNGVWLLLLQFLCSNATCNILHITIGSYFVIYSNWTTYSWNIIHFTFPSSSVPPLVHVCKPAAVEQDSLLYFKMNKCVICFHDALGNLHHKSTWSLKKFSKTLPLKILFVIISED